MPSSESLTGLMKWLRRDPWREAFGDTLEHHLGPACDAAGVPMDQLGDVIGNHWVMTLWGCAFEDFLTHDVETTGNIVDDYLKRRGWNEKALNKAYMAGLRRSVVSLYEVGDIRPGESCLARDLVRGGEPVRITERSATRSLKPWDRIAARVVEVRGKTVIGGGLLPFNHETSDELLAAIERIRARVPEDMTGLVADLGLAVGPEEITRAIDETEMLRLAAPMISTWWLKDALDRTLNPPSLNLCNSDGDEVEFFALHYRLLPRVTQKQVRAALDRIPDLRPASAKFWNWLASTDAPKSRAKQQERAIAFTSKMEDGSMVLGTLELKGKTLTLHVNSESRAERGRALLAPVLDGLASQALTERQTLEQAMSDRAARGPEQEASGLPPDKARQLTHAQLEDHYRQQLDEPIPALGDVSPRKAAVSAEGRQKLVSWLKRIENHSARHDPSDPMAGYDVTWMWDELGVAELRK